MKKQISPGIKAHLIRGAFYLLLFLAVCLIPSALGRQTTSNQSGLKRLQETPTTAASPKAAATPCNKIYNIGGSTLGGLTDTTRIYCTCTDSWSTGAPCPASLSGHASGFCDGIIFVA